MTPKELASVLLAVLAVSIGLEAVSGVSSALNSFAASYALGQKDAETIPFLRNLAQISLILIGGTLLFGVAPAVLVFLLRNRLASRWFPNSERKPTPEGHVLYAVGYGLLGVFFVIRGLQELVVAVIQAIGESDYIVERAWGSGGSGVVQLGAGLFLLMTARERIRRFAA